MRLQTGIAILPLSKTVDISKMESQQTSYAKKFKLKLRKSGQKKESKKDS